MDRVVRTCCQASHSECGVLVRVREGKVVEVSGDPGHPFTRGFVCVKGRAQVQVLYHPDRLKHPLRRKGARGSGEWVRVSWDEALDGIAASLTRVRDDFGARAIATMHGTGPRASTASTTLLAAALGTPNVVSTDWHICAVPTILAETLTYGQSVTMEVGPDYPAARCIILWGGNPVNSHPPRGRDVLEARRRGARLIVVDPRRTRLARQADLWLQVRPGTDAALALAMIHTIVEEGLYDHEFVATWCRGFTQLREHVAAFPPERVAGVTWVPADQIREAARLYARTRPAAFHHRVGVEQNINSTQTCRAFAILIALTGNLDVEGGNLLGVKPAGYTTDAEILGQRPGRFTLPDAFGRERIGSAAYPLVSGAVPTGTPKFVHPALALEAMLAGRPYPLKALYSAGANPLNIQGSRKVWQALHCLDLLAVTDFFMTPVAELADYVLPAATWLERDECCDFKYLNCVSARQKVLEPLYECRDDLQIVIDLARRVPWADRSFLPWDNVAEFNDFRVEGLGLTFEEFKEKGHIEVPRRYRKYEEEGFATLSGKVELFSELLAEHGYDPLPTFTEPQPSPVSTPEVARQYPLILISGGRTPGYFHSEGRQVPRLRKLAPDPEVEIHPATAAAAGIAEGDWVWIETPEGGEERVRFRARLTMDIHPAVVHAAHAWWFPEAPGPEHGCFDSNVNVVLGLGPPREPICGSVAARGTLCRITPAS